MDRFVYFNKTEMIIISRLISSDEQKTYQSNNYIMKLSQRPNALRKVYKACTNIILFFPGGNIPQGTNYTATYPPPSRKLSKLDEPDMQDTIGGAETIS